MTMADSSSDEAFYKMTSFNPEACKLKHKAIDKELEEGKALEEKNHQELKEMLLGLKKDMKEDNENLKNKIILTEKNIGDKIDQLDDFDDSLRGNGDPGVWETLRLYKWQIRIIFLILSIIIILALGGNFKGITKDKIKDRFSLSPQKQVDIPPHEQMEEMGPPKPKDNK